MSTVILSRVIEIVFHIKMKNIKKKLKMMVKQKYTTDNHFVIKENYFIIILLTNNVVKFLKLL